MTRRIVRFICGLVLRIFFRRIEIVGRERVPRKGGVIFVVNHPNALVDPLFLLCLAPRRVSFLAKSTLLRMPVIGALARSLDTLPVYRQQDRSEDTARNAETFRLCRSLLKRGASIAICPEGVSHNEPRLLPLKTGAARIALGAAAKSADAESLEINIVPVGLYYTAKTIFRSGALLRFGAPLAVPAVAMDTNGEPPRDAVAKLSDAIETGLSELIINADCKRTLDIIAAAERIWSSEEEAESVKGAFNKGTLNKGAFNLRSEQALRRRFIEEYKLHRQLQQIEELPANERHESSLAFESAAPRNVAQTRVLDELERRIESYDCALRSARIDPRDLAIIERSPALLLRQVALRLLLIVLLLPLAFLGVAAHYPAYRCIGFCANRFARGADDMVATLKMLAALLLFPLTWLLSAALCWWQLGLAAAPLALVILPLCGYIAMRFLDTEERLGKQLRALCLAVLRRKLFTRLVAERRGIRAAISELSAITELSISTELSLNTEVSLSASHSV